MTVQHSNQAGKLILAGDIGGTKTLLLVAEVTGNQVRVVHEQRFSSAAYSSIVPMVQELMQALSSVENPQRKIDSACFGVAGPINGRFAKLTNLTWSLDADEIAKACEFTNVKLINDFEAVGYGIEALDVHDFVTLQQGHLEAQGPRVVLGAGTGLGVCFLTLCGDHYQVFPSEGGHVDFAPADELESTLLRYLRNIFGHVSYERILSGSGLVAIYEFLLQNNVSQPPLELKQAMQAGDAAAAIAAFALSGKDPLASEALDLFVKIYGAQAGNLALTLLTKGGVYVAGGIAPKIIDRIKSGGFMQTFLDKGRYKQMLSNIPVNVIVNEKVGLLGAALVASRL
ncbi:glucokinase [Sulfurirhabdus autotrophica]|uniref:Glucokinase n=1 Tax=Sulfurirhabdus autotrophica TaxID=1706046 RepID=A0A4V2W253_9PROT|nr:glucokinase [Sulfurirhabdus autotrophica]TCV86739.1 glucokinase [Sulfurirhabdus autotrophica]